MRPVRLVVRAEGNDKSVDRLVRGADQCEYRVLIGVLLIVEWEVYFPVDMEIERVGVGGVVVVHTKHAVQLRRPSMDLRRIIRSGEDQANEAVLGDLQAQGEANRGDEGQRELASTKSKLSKTEGTSRQFALEYCHPVQERRIQSLRLEGQGYSGGRRRQIRRRIEGGRGEGGEGQRITIIQVGQGLSNVRRSRSRSRSRGSGRASSTLLGWRVRGSERARDDFRFDSLLVSTLARKSSRGLNRSCRSDRGDRGKVFIGLRVGRFGRGSLGLRGLDVLLESFQILHGGTQISELSLHLLLFDHSSDLRGLFRGGSKLLHSFVVQSANLPRRMGPDDPLEDSGLLSGPIARARRTRHGQRAAGGGGFRSGRQAGAGSNELLRPSK